MRFVLFVLFVTLYKARGKQFIVEAINNRTIGNHPVFPFQNATKKSAVIIKANIPFSLNFCIRQRSFVTLQNLRFLNFNSSTFINIRLNMLNFGSYFAVENRNKSQVFMDTGRFAIKQEIPTGWTVLKLYSDHPIAIDTFTLDVEDEKMDYLIFNCEVVCHDQSSFPATIPPNVTPALIEQNSFLTKCAEVDNVDVPIYHAHVKTFAITAKLPQYKSFSNRREANLTYCPHLSQTLWIFANFSVTPDSAEMRDNLSFLTFHENTDTSIDLIVLFILTGESTGSINADMGSRLFLRFTALSNPFDVDMRYKHKNGSMFKSSTKTFNSTQLENMWSIPDFTWMESSYNYISLHFKTNQTSYFKIDNLRLDRRPFVPDQTVRLYKSDDAIVDAVFVDMWWQGHERMNIRLNNGQLHKGFAFLQIYRPVPWTEGYNQIFILYQDGNARLLPVTPEGLDWIPFGTSVILGQVTRDSKRPHVSVSQVDIFPEDMTMQIYIKDGGSMRMILEVTDAYTKGKFDNISFMNDTFLFPFVTVRSMYVEEGNSDVDSIKVDDRTTYNIMDNWGSISGKSFAFHRRCMSKHLTLSPDIQVDITET